MNTQATQAPMSMAEQSLFDMIKEVSHDLTTSTANRVHLREDYFVNIFLPMFCGEVNPNTSTPITPEMWFNLARGPFNEVTVVDMKGAELFVVPPFFTQAAINPLDGTGKAATMPSVTDMLMTARMHAPRGAAAAENYMANEMDRRSFMFNKDIDNSENIGRWNEIYKRYGREPIPTNATQSTQPANVDIARDSSEFDSLC
jgi:hypothetical protein